MASRFVPRVLSQVRRRSDRHGRARTNRLQTRGYASQTAAVRPPLQINTLSGRSRRAFAH